MSWAVDSIVRFSLIDQLIHDANMLLYYILFMKRFAHKTTHNTPSPLTPTPFCPNKINGTHFGYFFCFSRSLGCVCVCVWNYTMMETPTLLRVEAQSREKKIIQIFIIRRRKERWLHKVETGDRASTSFIQLNSLTLASVPYWVLFIKKKKKSKNEMRWLTRPSIKFFCFIPAAGKQDKNAYAARVLVSISAAISGINR